MKKIKNFIKERILGPLKGLENAFKCLGMCLGASLLFLVCTIFIGGCLFLPLIIDMVFFGWAFLPALGLNLVALPIAWIIVGNLLKWD